MRTPQVRIKALENATNTSQLSNYERLAKLNDFEFKDGAKARVHASTRESGSTYQPMISNQGR